MGSVTEIWNTRNLERRLPRHWVRFHEEMHVSGRGPEQIGTLSIHQPIAAGSLFATLTFAAGQLTEEISRNGELVINIHGLKLVLVVRAVEDTRALLEFGVPRGGHANIALSA